MENILKARKTVLIHNAIKKIPNADSYVIDWMRGTIEVYFGQYYKTTSVEKIISAATKDLASKGYTLEVIE